MLAFTIFRPKNVVEALNFQPFRWITLGLAVVASLFLASCDTMDTAGFDSQAISQPTVVRLAPGDKLKITVFEEDRLTGEYEVDSSGAVSLPLAGNVRAAGLTPGELENVIAGKLRGTFLRSPKVTVSVVNFRPFYILGEVEKPGQYDYQTGLNVLSAMAIAGGGTYRASRAKVMIQRAGTANFQEFPMSPSVPVGPGDLIKVPERYF